MHESKEVVDHKELKQNKKKTLSVWKTSGNRVSESRKG